VQDHEIIALFYARSEQAIAALADKYGGLCARVARNILNDPQDAEECVNDAYLGAWNTIPPQRPDPLRTYVCRIVRNLAIRRYHANTAQKRGGPYDVALDELEACLTAGDTPEGQLTARELSQALDRFLGTLDRTDRVLFVRRYWYAESIGQLAQWARWSNNRVSVRLARLRKRLRLYLHKEGYIL